MATGSERNDIEQDNGRELPNFDPFKADPWLLGQLKPLSESPVWLAAGITVAGLLILVVVNAAQGTLGSLSPADMRLDLRAGLLGDTQAARRNATFDLLRDLPSLTSAIVAFVTPALIVYQWRAMASYVSDLYRTGLLFSPSCDDEWYRTELGRENTWLGRFGRATPLVLLAAISSTFLITRAQRSEGVFRAVGEGDGFAQQAYAAWWAGSDANFAGHAVYFSICTFFLYCVFVQNLVGMRLVWFMIRTRKRLSVDFDLENGDGVYGWLPMRRLLWTVYSSLGAHAFAIIVLAFTIQPNVFRTWLMPITVLYLVVFPFYVVIPLRIFARRRRVRKKEAAARVWNDLRRVDDAVTGTGDHDGALRQLLRAPHLHWKLDRIQRVPLTPFRATEVVIGAALYIAPLVTVLITAFGIIGQK